MILADSDVLIDHILGVPAVTAIINAYAKGDRLRTTAINCFELMSGAQGKRGDRVRHLLATIPVLPLDQEAAERAAELRRELERQGQYIGMGDSLIAGIALSQELPLFTRNRRHFERVTGLRLVDIEEIW